MVITRPAFCIQEIRFMTSVELLVQKILEFLKLKKKGSITFHSDGKEIKKIEIKISEELKEK